jgi:hypothetical protein
MDNESSDCKFCSTSSCSHKSKSNSNKQTNLLDSCNSSSESNNKKSDCKLCSPSSHKSKSNSNKQTNLLDSSDCSSDCKLCSPSSHKSKSNSNKQTNLLDSCNSSSDSELNNNYSYSNSDSKSTYNVDSCIHNKKNGHGIEHTHNHGKSYILNERKLVNKMIKNYHCKKSISIQDNRLTIKKLAPIYNELIDITHAFIDKANKIKDNLNPTKSSKTFRVIYDAYRSLVFNYYSHFTSILNVKYKGYDVLEYTTNNVVSSDNNRINYATCNNFYETNNCMDKSTFFYSVPGFTLLFNNETLSFRLVAKKSNFDSKCKIYKYDFLLIPGSNTNCKRVNKISFLKVLHSISDYKNDELNNLLEFINFLYHESNNIKSII